MPCTRAADLIRKFENPRPQNPVGAGFSYTTSVDGYCNDTKDCVASNLYSLLQQFNTAFPEAMAPGLFITGESCAFPVGARSHGIPCGRFRLSQVGCLALLLFT